MGIKRGMCRIVGGTGKVGGKVGGKIQIKGGHVSRLETQKHREL